VSEPVAGRAQVLISEGDAFLIMDLWELYPALGQQLGTVVRTFRTYAVSPEHLENASWTTVVQQTICPRLVHIVTTEIKVFRRVRDEVENDAA
jgi:hypothetical protein